MIRNITTTDVATTMATIEACGLFSPEELPTLRAQLDRSLAGDAERSETWTAEFDDESTPRGVAYCAEETLTDRVWNLLFIGVRSELHRAGIGSALLRDVEDRLRRDGQRMLIIETTNGPGFESTRAFYGAHGYSEEGTVRDFYEAGAHKITFRKLL